MQLGIEAGYRDFIGRVAEERGMAVEEVDRVARGQVWTGARARDLGLVDDLGGLDEALKAAAERAGVGDDYRVAYIEQQAGTTSRVLAALLQAVAKQMEDWSGPPATISDRWPDLDALVDGFTLNDFDDPAGLYAYCYCELE
jgi:protease-4